MIVYRCDLCGEVAECVQKKIDDREYDFCSRCWAEIESRLKGKSRPIAVSEMILLPPRLREKEETPEKPSRGAPPTILEQGS